jgi:hypothetical protein
MRSGTIRGLAAGATLAAISVGAAAPLGAATLSDLVAGQSLTQDDVVFENFAFKDTADPNLPPIVPVSPADIEVTTLSDGMGGVGLLFDFAPIVADFFDSSIGFGDFFRFELDFVARIASGDREITGFTLSFDDATMRSGNAEVEARFGPVDNGSPFAEVYDDADAPGAGLPERVASDMLTLGAPVTTLAFFGDAEGEVNAPGGAMTLSSLRLDLALDGDPPTVVPLPAGLPLLATALGGLALLRRARRKA